MKWIIVKMAANGVWDNYFIEDPKDGAHESQSASQSYAGKQAGLLVEYTDFDQAVSDCNKINTQNPSGHYDVCKLVEDVK